ncbi:28 kDa heat- and acid-stable phosphoprotein [Musca vetustissima]|uniref:28 kDa heat- and acid-stable phosphoprotein n=1 Tax=Musca vetustissima TaxID=27455 RepID=UPI002AB6516E|nr:28 kDa heat- and acid-stable phosphoprotein [Musca vetustissima]
MPRGKYVNHKGRSRHFTSPEEMQRQEDEEETSSSGEEEEEQAGSSGKVKKVVPGTMPSSSESEEDDSEEEDRDAKKGVASLIEIENPNRVVKKATQKIGNLNISDSPAKPELSRREREQIEKQKARLRYEKLHAEGKTQQAKADLARLALIRQQRAEAAAKREAEKKRAAEKKA